MDRNSLTFKNYVFHNAKGYCIATRGPVSFITNGQNLDSLVENLPKIISNLVKKRLGLEIEFCGETGKINSAEIENETPLRKSLLDIKCFTVEYA